MEKIIVGNFKMNLTSIQERDHYFELFSKEISGTGKDSAEIILCPPFVHLEAFNKWRKKNIKLGAQNMFSEKSGSFTGEISPLMLKSSGCEYVILGHSERRRFFCENDGEINLKVISALKQDLYPILCVGETKIQRENEETSSIIGNQVERALSKVSRNKLENIVIAYEPVWSVGSDIIPTSNEIMEVKLLIKKTLFNMFGKKYAEKVRIIYGGSVNSKNIRQVCVDPGIDGVLVGRESLNPHEFLRVADLISK